MPLRYSKSLPDVIGAILAFKNYTGTIKINQLNASEYIIRQVYRDPNSPAQELSPGNYKSVMIGMLRGIDDILPSTEIIWEPAALMRSPFSQTYMEVTRAVKALEEEVERAA